METTDVMDVTWIWMMETTTESSDQHQQYYELYTAARFITGLILYPVICLFGLTGNALIIVVLAHKAALSSTDILLAALAISDAVKLINDLLYSATCATMLVNPDAGQSMYAYLYPYAHFVFNAAVCVSAWLVVSLAVERYLLVCWPARTRAMTSAARSNPRSLASSQGRRVWFQSCKHHFTVKVMTSVSRSMTLISRSLISVTTCLILLQGHDLGF